MKNYTHSLSLPSVTIDGAEHYDVSCLATFHYTSPVRAHGNEPPESAEVDVIRLAPTEPGFPADVLDLLSRSEREALEEKLAEAGESRREDVIMNEK